MLCNRQNARGKTKIYTLDIATKELYQDFEREFDYRIENGTNSGVYVRGRVEMQLVDDALPQHLDGNQKNGSIYKQYAPLVDSENAMGSWNSIRIRYVGSKTTAHLNGTMIHDDRLITEPTDGNLPMSNNVNEFGPILLQNLTGRIWIRDMRIRHR